MTVENKLGRSFSSLAQRILYSYVATYPEFKPVDNSISYASQQQMFSFISDLLHLFYEHPEVLQPLIGVRRISCY